MGFALRRVVDDEISADELLAFLKQRKKNKKE
jgi:hypothetical protein